MALSLSYSVYESPEESNEDNGDHRPQSSGPFFKYDSFEVHDDEEQEERPDFTDFGAQTGNRGSYSWHVIYPVVRKREVNQNDYIKKNKLLF